MTTVVLDVSGAMEILFRRDKAEKFDEAVTSATLRLSSDLYLPELSNTLRNHYRAKILTEAQCSHYVEEGMKLVDYFVNSKDVWREALHEGIANNHSVYDMLYLVIARRNDGILVSNDGPLVKICEKLNIKYC
jgi:predicted nucleic acid-binding protein